MPVEAVVVVAVALGLLAWLNKDLRSIERRTGRRWK